MQNNSSTENFNYEAFFKISYGLYIVSTKSASRMNGYISNTVFQITADPVQFAVCCSKNNFTAEMITQSGYFTVSVLSRDAGQELISLFGYQSGRDVDKFAKIKYIVTESGIPAVTQDSLAWFECRVKQSIDAGTHVLFIAEVTRTEVTDNNNEPLTYAWYRDQRKGKAPKNAPSYIATDKSAKTAGSGTKYKCVVCGHIYDPAEGDPNNGIPAGTDFKDLPADWKCPICGAAKEDFEAII